MLRQQNSNKNNKNEVIDEFSGFLEIKINNSLNIFKSLF